MFLGRNGFCFRLSLVHATRKYSVKMKPTGSHSPLSWTPRYTDRRISNDMSAIRAIILTFSVLSGRTEVSGVLRRPTNVRLTSYNMNLVLRWDSPDRAVSDLLYTAEYNTSVSNYKVGCVNISTHECDFTNFNSISEYGTYTGRVRAQLGAVSSAWVESNQITLDKDTIIGSPNVTLLSNGATIEVSIKDPVFMVSTLRNAYIFSTYNITFWKDGQKEKATSISNVQQNRLVLSNLDLWTKYCIQVEINTEKNPNPSEPSETVCESTTNKEAPWVAAVVTFVVMAMAVALLVVAVVYHKRISHFLCPKDALPQHFKECLLASPKSPMYVAMQNSPPPKEIYHQVIIISDNRTMEERHPLETAETNCNKQPDVREGRVDQGAVIWNCLEIISRDSFKNSKIID